MDPTMIPLAGIAMVTILGGIVLGGLMIRFAIKPSVEAIVRVMGEAQAKALSPGADGRMDRMESQLDDIKVSLAHLSETRDFDRQLGAGAAAPPDLANPDPHSRTPLGDPTA